MGSTAEERRRFALLSRESVRFGKADPRNCRRDARAIAVRRGARGRSAGIRGEIATRTPTYLIFQFGHPHRELLGFGPGHHVDAQGTAFAEMGPHVHVLLRAHGARRGDHGRSLRDGAYQIRWDLRSARSGRRRSRPGECARRCGLCGAANPPEDLPPTLLPEEYQKSWRAFRGVGRRSFTWLSSPTSKPEPSRSSHRSSRTPVRVDSRSPRHDHAHLHARGGTSRASADAPARRVASPRRARETGRTQKRRCRPRASRWRTRRSPRKRSRSRVFSARAPILQPPRDASTCAVASRRARPRLHATR